MNQTYRERVREALTGRQTPVRANVLAKELEYSESTVGQALRDLVADGIATKNREGFYLRPKVRFL